LMIAEVEEEELGFSMCSDTMSNMEDEE
jgi:hypothetical protein